MHSASSIRTLAAVGLLLAPIAAFAADGTFERTLNVSGPVDLNISTGAGNIHVSPGGDNQVHIIGHVHSSGFSIGNGSPEERVRRVVQFPPIDQAGNTIRVGRNSRDLNNISIDYEVTTPRNTRLTANTGSGDLRIYDVHGSNKLEAGSGNIEIANLGGDVSLETGSGDIHGGFYEARSVRATAGSGSIRLSNVHSDLRAETGSGDLEIDGQPSGPWTLTTGSGNITISTHGARFTLDSSTGSGNFHSDPPITTHGSLDRHHVSGEINGGGPIVRVETGSGDIRIH